MSVEVTSDELKAVLQDEEVQTLIVEKLKAKKTEGLAAALTAQYKSLGVITDEPESTSAADATGTEGTEATASESSDAAA